MATTKENHDNKAKVKKLLGQLIEDDSVHVNGIDVCEEKEDSGYGIIERVPTGFSTITIKVYGLDENKKQP